MITAVCLNPCIDKTVSIKSFTYGGMNRIIEKRTDASGKGVNVALASAQLGLRSRCTGFLYSENGKGIEQRLSSGGVPYDFVYCGGEVRTNMKLRDLSTGQITEINEGGTPVSEENIRDMKQLIEKLSADTDIMVFSGSVPPGPGDGIYRELIEIAGKNCKTVLDAEGAKFSEGLKARPYMIKPNLYELRIFCGHDIQTIPEILTAAKSLIDMGIKIVSVSMGGDGALITDGSESYFAPAMKVDVKSATGAGDCMVAGFCLGIEKGLPLKEIFRCGTAAATSSVTTPGTGLIDVPLYEELLDKVSVRAI